ncbi:tRNA (5-methylaminomethyl-2-thiouridine)(34)-methyltransferase MnmD, partial [Actibacterium sp.]|uniref:tRNA (5-methylaminomethyl-2-thiouridine)(34)-methyltransferase MnmD n=1 Tax=Actibacterium sp. TaxID=1872125 RepID=UPI0035699804
FPMQAAEIERALTGFPQARAIADPFLSAWGAGETQFDLGGLQVTVILGDARETLPAWQGQADAWFLDGFSPAKNPELWSPELLAAVGQHTAPGGTAATYTAAGHVRRALAEAGFEVSRQSGFGRKRHMSVARKPG